MKLKLIISLLSIVGMSACSTSTIVENRSCDLNEDFPWYKTWNQNCSSADNSNGNSSEYSSLRELNSSANDIVGSENRDGVTERDENAGPEPNNPTDPNSTVTPPAPENNDTPPTTGDEGKEDNPPELGDGLDQDL